MKRTLTFIALVLATAGICVPTPVAGVGPAVTVKNTLNLARTSETIALSAAEVTKALGIDDVRKVHVKDAAGTDLLTQAVDVNDDGKFEELIFQVDIGPNETKNYGLSAGDRVIPKPSDFKAYGRFVRERRDDFAWENDRIAHRMYGVELETWPLEPLTSSTVDVWTKRVTRSIINEWYMIDDYHRDNGTGGDFYSAGKSRGCGGNGLWVGGKLYPSANFRDSRVYANGPIRVMFELRYQTWDAGGMKVSEVKRITLDAGQNLDRFESRYTVEGGAKGLLHAVGIKNNTGSTSVNNREQGTLRAWEAVKGGPGNVGLGVVIDPSAVTEFTQADNNYLVVAKVPDGAPAVYYAGFVWDQTTQIPGGTPGWDKYLADAARRIKSPLEVTLSAK